jgi:hypothetical protein
MSREIAGDASPELIELARRIAEAEVDVMRIRRVRNHLLGRAVSNLGDRIPVRPPHVSNATVSLGHTSFPSTLADLAAKQSVTSENTKIVKDLPEFGREFAVIDSYERRALSRRKFATRAFDEARRMDRAKTPAS